MKKIFLALMLAVLGFCHQPNFAQAVQIDAPILTLDVGVKAHTEIDANYQKFGEGVRKMDASIIANLFAEDAVYLSPDQDIMQGRKYVEDSFAANFSRIKANNARRENFFRIVKRRVYKDSAYDVGIYTNKIYRDDKFVREVSTKFVIVWEKVKKDWKIKVDSDSPLKPQTKD